MTYPTDTDNHSTNIDQARDELREGIENSRSLLRQSRVLIELSECQNFPAANIDEPKAAY